jgi:hypothetical protein
MVLEVAVEDSLGGSAGGDVRIIRGNSTFRINSSRFSRRSFALFARSSDAARADSTRARRISTREEGSAFDETGVSEDNAGALALGLGVREAFLLRCGEGGSNCCGRLRVRPRRLLACPLDPSSWSSNAYGLTLLEALFLLFGDISPLSVQTVLTKICA